MEMSRIEGSELFDQIKQLQRDKDDEQYHKDMEDSG